MPQASSKKTTATSDIFINHCIRLSRFPKSWKKIIVITLSKHGKDSKVPQNLGPINLLSEVKLVEKVIPIIVQRHIQEKGRLNASQIGFSAHHFTTLKCMRLWNHVTLNFSNNMSTAKVFLDNENAFDTTCHLDLLYTRAVQKATSSKVVTKKH
jgi:hypothetical protein